MASPPNGEWHEDGLGGLTEEERAKQREYWAEHSKKGSNMENMMLDRSAAKLDLLDRPEVLSLLPPYRNKRVLELASGIGRFTGSIASEAESVVTVEFMEDFLNKNRELHSGKFSNIEFICSDVLAMDLAPSSFDIVFSCWIHMYLSDDEVRLLTLKSLGWLKPGGHIFLRESCFRQSGDVSRAFNPSHYRHPSFYTGIFHNVVVQEADGSYWGLEVVRSRNLEAYVEVKGNKGQICWLLKKVPTSAPSPSPCSKSTSPSPSPAATSPEAPVAPAANGHHHDHEGHGHASSSCASSSSKCESSSPSASLATHEGLFGAGFSSNRLGGPTVAHILTQAVGGCAGERVLELGCGVGGVAIGLASTSKARVWAQDEDTTAIETAIERSMKEAGAHTVLEAAAHTDASGEFAAAVVHEPPVTTGLGLGPVCDASSRLAPGGRLVASALASTDHDHGVEGVRAEVASSLGVSPDHVEVHDHTQQLVEVLSEALAQLKAKGSDVSAEDALALSLWSQRLDAAREERLKWVVLRGTKAAVSNGNGHAHAHSNGVCSNGHH